MTGGSLSGEKIRSRICTSHCLVLRGMNGSERLLCGSSHTLASAALYGTMVIYSIFTAKW